MYSISFLLSLHLGLYLLTSVIAFDYLCDCTCRYLYIFSRRARYVRWVIFVHFFGRGFLLSDCLQDIAWPEVECVREGSVSSSVSGC